MQDKTNWDKYYQKSCKAAMYSRKITGGKLIKYIKQYSINNGISIAEIGGANSCFFDLIQAKIKPQKYVLIDNNQLGLDKLKEQAEIYGNCELINADILDFKEKLQLDFVYSIGVVEHFSIEGTAQAIKVHFDVLKPGGIAIISFPTPTFLYCISRFISQSLGMWIWYDERPLQISEVLRTSNS